MNVAFVDALFDATWPLEQKTVAIEGKLFWSILSTIHCFHIREDARIRTEQTKNGGELRESETGAVVQGHRAKDIADVVLSRPGGE